MSTMKKRKQDVLKEDDLIISSTSSMKRLGENCGPFPIDIILEILSRLPAKSIARFRCVSKEWASIFCSPKLTDMFLKLSSTRPRLLFTFETMGKWSFFSAPQCLISDQNSSLVVVDNHMHVTRDYSFSVCVPACGSLCTKYERELSGRKDVSKLICNPSTGRFKPALPKLRTRRGRVITFLCYDPIEKLHKVLGMTASEKPYTHRVEEHQALTLGTGKWKWRMIVCPEISYYPRIRDNEICINGVLYYLAEESVSRETSMIVCFDVKSEKLKFVINKAFKDLKFPSTLINYKGKLGILHPNSMVTGFELWVIDDIEKHKWSRHIHVLPPLWKDFVAKTEVHIVGIAGASEIVFSPCVFSNPFYIFCYNMEKNSITRVEIQGIGPNKGQNIHTFTNHVENVNLIM